MRHSVLAIIGIALGLMALSAPASAQNTRTWVSHGGDDANPCSVTSPCKTFAGALSKTNAGGEINVMDASAPGAFSISKSITIRADHVEAGVLVGVGTNAIAITGTGANDKVVLEGLDIEGLGKGTNGITITGSGTVDIVRCTIRNFTQNGINVAGTAGARAVVYNSVIVNNNGGLSIEGASGAANSALVQDSVLDNNVKFATQTAGGNTLVLTDSSLTGSPSSIIAASGASVISYGNNVLENAGAPTKTLKLQ
jgi:hypothetical protein